MNINTIIELICSHQEITLEQFHSKSRARKKSLAHQAFSYFMYEYIGFTLTKIAKHIRTSEPYDHTSIITQKETFKDLVSSRFAPAVSLHKTLLLAFRNGIVFGTNKSVDWVGYESFKFPPEDDSLIELKNSIPFAIGFFSLQENCVFSHGQKISVEGLEWRYYV